MIVAALLVPACVPDYPPDNDEYVRFKPDTAMGQIQKAGVMRVGVEVRNPFATKRSDGGYEGFVVDLAQDVADALRVDVEIVSDDPEALQEAVRGQDPALDVVFPLVPITERLVRRNALADPYWVGHTRTLGRPGADGAAPCDLKRLGEACAARFRAGEVDAVMGPDVDLITIATAVGDGAITGDELTTEGYGPIVRDDFPGLAEYVEDVLYEAKAEGRWEQWYDRWIAPHFAEEVDPPTMTAEEAAALYPVELETG